MPDYEIIIAGRIGPLVASCLPGLHPTMPPATVLHALAPNPAAVLKILGALNDQHLTLVDIRIDPAPTAAPPNPAHRSP